MARSRLEIADELLSQVTQMRKLLDQAEQAPMLPDEERVKLAEALIDTSDQLDRLDDEWSALIDA